MPTLLPYFLLLPLILVRGVRSICPCVVFNQTGRFISPNYPQLFEPTECILYHFYAPKQHIVQISFDFFSMPSRSEGRCDSRVSMFEQSEDGMVDPFNDRPDVVYCGRDLDNGQVFHSLSQHFVMYVHSTDTSKGFSGEYKFIPRANLTSDALQTAECAFRAELEKGIIYSPRWPYFPAAHTNCSYLFPARKGLTLSISSTIFTLAVGSSMEVFELQPARVRILREDQNSQTFYVSSQHSILIHFYAGDSNIRNVGFRLEYVYGTKEAVRPLPTIATGTFSDCLVRIDSTNSKNGVLSSDEFSTKHASLPAKCMVIFEGTQSEKVSLKFTYFNLYAPDHVNTTKRCTDHDHLTAAVRVGTRFSRIDAWCGNDRPPQLMSSTNILQLEYNTKSSRALRDSSPKEIGFKLEYKFHTDWDMERMQAEYDPSRGCRFVFNSSRSLSGKLWSVNYPGLYPRNLHCEYIFHGNEEQIVHIHFEYFDVEGFNQCDEQSQSDFVLFSNYQSPDRNNRRVCGKQPPRIATISESNYYRMVFSTNEIFDATGFYAHYQFLTQQKAQISKVKFTPSAGASTCLIFTFIAIMISILC